MEIPSPLPSGIARFVPADKTLHKFLTGYVERIPRCIPENELHLPAVLPQIHVYPRARLRIFADIVHQVVNHAPEMPAVRHHIHRASPASGSAVSILRRSVCPRFSDDLHHRDARLEFFQMHGEIASGSFRRLDQILDQLFQPV